MGILSKRDELRMKPEAFLIAIFHLFSFNLFKPTNLWVFFEIMHKFWLTYTIDFFFILLLN